MSGHHGKRAASKMPSAGSGDPSRAMPISINCPNRPSPPQRTDIIIPLENASTSSPQPRHSPAYSQPLHFRSDEHTSELQSLMRISYAVFCLNNTTHQLQITKKQHP